MDQMREQLGLKVLAVEVARSDPGVHVLGIRETVEPSNRSRQVIRERCRSKIILDLAN